MKTFVLSDKRRSLLEAELRKRGLATTATIPPLVRVDRSGELPLSFGQERLWFLDQLEPGSSAYNMARAFQVDGALDVGALERALQTIVDRHEVLRTSYQAANGRPSAVLAPIAPFSIRFESFTTSPTPEADARRAAAEEMSRPFDLSSAPLLRATVLEIQPDSRLLVVSMHHIVSDGWSVGVLVRELISAYGALAQGGSVEVAPLPIQYVDYASWQRGWLSGEVLDKQLSYWREQLSGASTLELPTDRPRPAMPSGRGAAHRFEVGAETVSALSALCRAEGASLFMGLLAAWQLLLSRYSGQQDVSVGTPIANRTRAETEGLIGFFVNTLVMRMDLGGEPSFRELVRRAKETALGAYGHQEVPFEKVVEALSPERDTSRTPLFQVMFALQNAPTTAVELPGVTMTPLEGEGGSAKFDLTLTAVEAGGGLTCTLQYATDLFDESTVERMSSHLAALLNAVSATPDTCAEDARLIREDEERLLLEQWSGRETSYVPEGTLQERLSATAHRSLDALAVTSGDEALTFGELERLATRMAHGLRARGVGPDRIVALLLPRDLGMVIAMFGTMQAGAAFLPLDPSYPQDRLAFMLSDCDAALVVVPSSADRSSLPEGAEIVSLGDLLAEDGPPRASLPRVSPDSLAYVIYTSGSTGRPKGTMVPHRAVVGLVDWQIRHFEIGPQDRASQFASSSFDASVSEVWVHLVAGASVHIIPDIERA